MSRGAWAALGLLLLEGASGCSKKRLPPSAFAIGMFGVEKPEAMRLLGEEGFNAVQISGDPARLPEMAAAARKAGIGLMVPPNELLRSDIKREGFPIAAWYLADEPDVHRTKPADLRALDLRVKDRLPGIPTTFVVGDGRAMKTYADSGDILMVDWYPVPHLPLTSAGDHVRWTVEASKGKPVWAVLQAMDWRDYEQKDPRKPRVGRFPNSSEIRFMTYDAILQGARGVWYFNYTRPDGQALSDFPELWFALTSVVREISALSPILASGVPATLPFEQAPGGPSAKAWKSQGRDYIVVLNRQDTVALMPRALLETKWRPLFEVRRDPRELLQMDGGEYRLKPYQVMVLESSARR